MVLLKKKKERPTPMPRHGHRGYAAAESAVGTSQIGMEGPHTAWVCTIDARKE